jgi:hypothetical protein
MFKISCFSFGQNKIIYLNDDVSFTGEGVHKKFVFFDGKGSTFNIKVIYRDNNDTNCMVKYKSSIQIHIDNDTNEIKFGNPFISRGTKLELSAAEKLKYECTIIIWDIK